MTAFTVLKAGGGIALVVVLLLPFLMTGVAEASTIGVCPYFLISDNDLRAFTSIYKCDSVLQQINASVPALSINCYDPCQVAVQQVEASQYTTCQAALNATTAAWRWGAAPLFGNLSAAYIAQCGKQSPSSCPWMLANATGHANFLAQYGCSNTLDEGAAPSPIPAAAAASSMEESHYCARCDSVCGRELMKHSDFVFAGCASGLNTSISALGQAAESYALFVSQCNSLICYQQRSLSSAAARTTRLSLSSFLLLLLLLAAGFVEATMLALHPLLG